MELEFNTIKTISTINKDKTLQNVFKQKFGDYKADKLIENAKLNKLADETIDFLENLFNEVISVKEDLSDVYQNIPENKIPRRYGKIQILKDIEEQGGDATPLQRTMLNLSELKSIQINLASKGVSDRFKGTQKLSKRDLNDINAAIRDFKNKVNHITKKRK